MTLNSKRLLAIVAVIVIFILSWYTMFSEAIANNVAYNNYLKTAREKDKLEMYDDANDNYNAALAMKDTLSLRLEIAEFYLNNNNIGQYVGHCEGIKNDYPYEAAGYELLVDYYSEKNDIKECYSVLSTATKRKVVSEKLDKFRNDLAYKFELDYMKFEDVGPYSGGYFAAKKINGSWGYVDWLGRVSISMTYEVAGDFSADGFAAVKNNKGKFVIIDKTGRTKHVDAAKKNIEDCGVYVDGFIPVKFDGKYHYCDIDFNKAFGDYDFAGSFNNGVAAVKNADVWTLVNTEGKAISSDTYSDVKLDDKGMAFRSGVAFVKKDDKYILIDTNGKQVGKEKFDDARTFTSDQPAAVMVGGKWGYINTAGEYVVKPTYADAKSFSNGFAAVQNDGKWGYIIEKDYSLKINYEFSDAYNFSDCGTAFVKSGGNWTLLSIYSIRYGG